MTILIVRVSNLFMREGLAIPHYSTVKYINNFKHILVENELTLNLEYAIQFVKRERGGAYTLNIDSQPTYEKEAYTTIHV